MKSMLAPAWRVLRFVGWILVFGWNSMLPTSAPAQSAVGNNAVYNVAGNTVTVVGSNSFIDASAFSGTDICAKINTAYHSVPSGRAGTVVDARGITVSPPCISSPFNAPTGRSVTVLLPALTITIQTAWAIPDQSQVIGEGAGRTILQASSSFTDPFASPNKAMLHMGTPSLGGAGGGLVFEVRIQHLGLDGQGQIIDGIDNQNAEEQSYVDDVAINNVNGNGLFLGHDPLFSQSNTNAGTSNHSGPYTNISFQTASAVSSTACANILDAEPRGLHSVTCIGNAVASNAAILLDGSNVSLEDIRIDGFHDGIRIGSQSASNSPAEADLLLNISGTATVNSPTTNLVHVSNFNIGARGPNLTMMGVTSVGNTTILDDLTVTTLPFSTDPSVGMYALGRTGSGGYSRFSTSPRTPTWASGTTVPSGTCPSNGSLFSLNAATNGTTLWACVNTGTSTSWSPVK